MLGNDIVDLHFCESPQHHHVRYLERICSDEEARAVRRSADPHTALASLWASKEAAYKAFKKQLPECRFVPRLVIVEVGDHDPAQADKEFSVFYSGMKTQVRLFVEDRWVHAVAADPEWRVYWRVREIGEGSPGECAAENESVAVRLLASALLAELRIEDTHLQFAGRIPELKGGRARDFQMQASLAHHGAFVAAAVAWLASPATGGSTVTGKSEALCSSCTA